MRILIIILMLLLVGCSSAVVHQNSGKFAQLDTDISQASIELDSVLSGGVAKDGIPPIDNPNYVSIAEAAEFVADSTEGMLISLNGETHFYPFSILVWHEIVNAEIGGEPVAVTFCPLCGSAIAFERTVNGDVVTFGVSGLLYESNLLMYDRLTESLWSQSRGEAVVGELLGTKLVHVPVQQPTFAEVREEYPAALVLSTDTGHRRDYQGNPYSGYADTEETIFPISVEDTRLPAKEIVYVVPLAEGSVAIPWRDFKDGEYVRSFAGQDLRMRKVGSKVEVFGGDELLPGYFEMWFSWATQHAESGGVLWNE